MIGAMFEANIKYKRLNELIGQTIALSRYAPGITVVIDLKSVLRKAYRMKELEVPPMLAIEDISSDVINLIGFYRNYFAKMNRSNTFYLLYSESECELMKADFPGYKKHYYEKYISAKDDDGGMRSIVSSAVSRIKSVVKYTPDAYYIDTSKLDEFCYCDYIVTKGTACNKMALILSDDPVMYQCLGSNCCALDIKGMSTKAFLQQNTISLLCEKDTKLSSSMLSLILSIAGSDRYSIDGVPNYGYKKAEKAVSDLVSKNIILDTKYMVFPKKEMLQSEDKNIIANIGIIERNYKLILPMENEFKNSAIIGSEIEHVSKPVVTRREFAELNNRVFLNYPINVSCILSGY